MQNDIVKRQPLQPQIRGQVQPFSQRAPLSVAATPIADPSEPNVSQPDSSVVAPPQKVVSVPSNMADNTAESAAVNEASSEPAPVAPQAAEAKEPDPQKRKGGPVFAVSFAVVICLCLVGLALYAGMQQPN